MTFNKKHCKLTLKCENEVSGKNNEAWVTDKLQLREMAGWGKYGWLNTDSEVAIKWKYENSFSWIMEMTVRPNKTNSKTKKLKKKTEHNIYALTWTLIHESSLKWSNKINSKMLHIENQHKKRFILSAKYMFYA